MSRPSRLRLLTTATAIACSVAAHALEYRGRVSFGGVSVSGVIVTVTLGAKAVSAVSDAQGSCYLADLPEGQYKVSV